MLVTVFIRTCTCTQDDLYPHLHPCCLNRVWLVDIGMKFFIQQNSNQPCNLEFSNCCSPLEILALNGIYMFLGYSTPCLTVSISYLTFKRTFYDYRTLNHIELKGCMKFGYLSEIQFGIRMKGLYTMSKAMDKLDDQLK